MLYADVMSAVPPPVPEPEETAGAPELLQLGPAPGQDEPCLRADAARNRARLLEAAARLVAEQGAACVTMEAVAAAASVGKGTVFRRFGDRTGLLAALLDHSEKKFQAAVLGGPRRWARERLPWSGCTPSAAPCCAARTTNSTCNWPPIPARTPFHPAAPPVPPRARRPAAAPGAPGRGRRPAVLPADGLPRPGADPPSDPPARHAAGPPGGGLERPGRPGHPHGPAGVAPHRTPGRGGSPRAPLPGPRPARHADFLPATPAPADGFSSGPDDRAPRTDGLRLLPRCRTSWCRYPTRPPPRPLRTALRPTSADVARLAGVSRATVSYVLNNTSAVRISEPTRRRVHAAAEELGYVPHAAARSLRAGHSRLVLMPAPTFPSARSTAGSSTNSSGRWAASTTRSCSTAPSACGATRPPGPGPSCGRWPCWCPDRA